MTYSGWRIKNSSGFSYTIESIVLNDGDVFRVCADSIKGNCDDEWSGGNVWAGTDTLTLIDDAGAIRLEMPYTGKSAGNFVSDAIDFDGVVYTKKDSVPVCHSANGSQYSRVNGNVSNIAKGKGGHGEHAAYDIIPPFFYFVDGQLGYYNGLNWEEGGTVYEANCGK